MAQAQLHTVTIGDLHPHPDNPRLLVRDDVVGQIAAQIAERGFGEEHALLVRPADDGYQIVSGHHRHIAAQNAGVAEVPCWVRDMDDREALMHLVLANAQGELSPLEIGMHALTAVPLGKRGRGNSGDGLTAYAEQIGRDQSYVSHLRAAAEVVTEIQGSTPEFSLTGLLPKAMHLYEISKADQVLWPLLARHMLDDGWKAADTAHHVAAVAEFDIPDRWWEWLPLEAVVARYLHRGEFSPRTVARLLAVAGQALDWIAANMPDPDQAAAEFIAWLTGNTGGVSWEPRAVSEYLARLIAEQFVVKGWHHGDWRDHLADLEDGSVRLLLTDPPYGQEFQSDRRRDRRQPRKHAPIVGDDESAATELAEALDAFRGKLADDAHLLVFCGWASEPAMRQAVEKAGYVLRGSLVWDKQTRGMGDRDTTFAPAHERILHAVKGSPLLFRRAPDLLSHPRCDSSRHPAEKPVPLLAELIEAATAEGQLVADPFGGVASTVVAARDTARRWWACETDEEFWRIGEERLS